MHHYRLYFMDPHNGHIDRFAEFEAPDDEAARSEASRHIGRNPLELWCHGRKVQRLEACSIAPAPRPRTFARHI